MPTRKKIGDILVNNGYITDAQLKEALDHQKRTGLKLGDSLVDLKLLSEHDFLEVLAEQQGIPLVDLKHHEFDLELVKSLPEAYARQFSSVILSEEDGIITVGMVDPANINLVDQLNNILQKPTKLALVSPHELQHVLDLIYRRTADIETFAQELGEAMEADKHSFSLDELESSGDLESAPVNKLLRSMFEDGVQVNASDIHIEPERKYLRIRTRVDGVLSEQIVNNTSIADPLALRLKLLAGLNISETRLPQDGRFSITVKAREIDIRLSTLPSQYGESIVMRFLYQDGDLVDLERVGMPPAIAEDFRRLIHAPHGLLVVTGPTGSGKSTTLYAAMHELNDPTKKIITVEDPVEYRMPGLCQVQINSNIGLTFAGVLRTTLRQDPDIMLIGEMRDEETASIAMRASVTGHFVLSTLHTNDAASTAIRLIDMNVPGYMVASATVGVLAQRLLRLICDSCKEEVTPTDEELKLLERQINIDPKQKFHKGKGCAHCHQQGYSGRQGVFELLEFNADMLDALRVENATEFAQHAEKAMKGKKMIDHAYALAKEGATSLEEVIRVTAVTIGGE